MTPSTRIDKHLLRRFVHAAVVLVASASYLSYVFSLTSSGFWSSGIGDWMDPYFINALLEHWYSSVRSFSDPSSPPMYFPAQQTMGYSHGLILYAALYVPVRLFVHPFLAYNLTLLLVIWAGVVSLHVLLRKLGIAFTESLVLSAFFVSSKNVINGGTGTWSQRASVFLIPPVALLLLTSWRLAGTRGAFLLASLAGLLAALMYIQDFYTAHFAVLLVVLLSTPVLLEQGRVLAGRMLSLWREAAPAARIALALAMLASAWTAYLLLFGGASVHLLGVRIRSHDWQRPLVVAVVSAIVFIGLCGRTVKSAAFGVRTRWALAVAVGAIVGTALFLWIYLPAYHAHRSFPEEHLLNSLAQRDPQQWRSVLDVVRDLGAYDTKRPFTLVFVIGLSAWLPWFDVDRKVRLHSLWFLVISLIVLLIPLRFEEFSIWRMFFEPLPGFAVIRDPKRIIYLFELAVALAGALFLARLPRTSFLRLSASVLAVILLVTEWNRETFVTARPIEVYDRWVGRSMHIDASCASFFIKKGPPEYSARSEHKWTLYNIDAIFVSLKHAIPTLNGYSAWFPDRWDLFNPEETEYDGRVKRWIERHQLGNVCGLDIAAAAIEPAGF